MLKKLEAIRGLAAVYVVIHHIIGFTTIKDIISPMMRFPFRFGQEAVIVFFLLSGFVIHYSTYNKKIEFKTYVLKRFRRIYPIAICSMILSVFVFWFNNYNFTITDVYQLFGNLLMLQDTSNKPGLWVDVFLKNHALWSLSYEWFFYLLYFPLINILKHDKLRIYKILGISTVSWFSYLIYPNHFSLVVSYLIIWWVGVECASIFRQYGNFKFSDILPLLICLFFITMLSFIPVISQYYQGTLEFNPIKFPIITARHFGFSGFVILIGWLWWNCKLYGFNFLIGYFDKFASLSYALYLVHFPIIWLVIPLLTNLWLIIIVKIFLMLVIAYILERKFQPFINNIIKI